MTTTATLNGRLDNLITAMAAALSALPQINDAATGGAVLWSANQINAAIAAAVASGSAAEGQIITADIAAIKAQLAADEQLISALEAKISTDEGNASALAADAIRTDLVQNFTPAQQAQALMNLGLNGAEFFVDQDLANAFAAQITIPTMQSAIANALSRGANTATTTISSAPATS